MAHEVVSAVRHGHREPGSLARLSALEQRREHVRDGTERTRCQVRDLDRWKARRSVLEGACPAEVVEVVSRPSRMGSRGAEARDRAVHDRFRDVVGPDAEPRCDSWTEALEHDIRPRTEGTRELRVCSQVADDRLRSGTQRGVPGGRGLPHWVAVGGFDTDDARTETEKLATRVRAGQVAREVDDESPGERLHAGGAYYPGTALTDRSIASERPKADQATAPERRTLILEAAVRVFARRGYHGSRVGEIAEEAGVAHGLLYHYFSSKEQVLQTVFRENWGELLERFRAVEAADEPAGAKLEGIAKILLRTWRNDPDLVTVMVREVARSPQLQGQVEEIGEAFAIVQRVIEQGQAEGTFRRDVDPRLASWIVYGGLEEVLTGWVLGQLPDGDEEVALAERTAIDLALGGLTAA